MHAVNDDTRMLVCVLARQRADTEPVGSNRGGIVDPIGRFVVVRL